jgi:cytosine/uracil/thiamine/allantoin permease
VIPALRFWYDYSWFVGFMVSFVAYYAMMAGVERKPSS